MVENTSKMMLRASKIAQGMAKKRPLKFIIHDIFLKEITQKK